MIGVTQLLSRPLGVQSPGTVSNPFTSHADVASSGLPDGYYYFNDGTRTRQYYFSVDGSAAGQSGNGGWARLDSTSLPNPYSGQECASGSGTITSDGTIKVNAQNNGGPLGSTAHGGCGTGYNSTYFKARYISITDFSGVANTGSAWYNSTYLYIYNAPETLRSDWYGNQSGNGGYYYPGAYAFTTGSATANLLLANADSYNTSVPSSPASSLATSANYSGNTSTNYYRFITNTVFDMYNTEDRVIHVGQSVSGSISETSFKLWFKF